MDDQAKEEVRPPPTESGAAAEAPAEEGEPMREAHMLGSLSHFLVCLAAAAGWPD